MQKEIRTITRKWGNSIAVVIPNDVVNKQHIKENTQVTITIEKARPKAGALWGLLKGKITKPTQQIKDELREGWMSDSDKEQEAQWKWMRNQKK